MHPPSLQQKNHFTQVRDVLGKPGAKPISAIFSRRHIIVFQPSRELLINSCTDFSIPLEATLSPPRLNYLPDKLPTQAIYFPLSSGLLGVVNECLRNLQRTLEYPLEPQIIVLYPQGLSDFESIELR